MFLYLQQFFDFKVFINDEDESLYVREDVYDVVFAIINSHAVYDEGDHGYDVYTYEDCLKWKNRMLDEKEYIVK